MDFNRFDVSTKELVWDDPAAWLDGFGIGPRGPVEVIDSDITTLSAAADKVIRVGGAEPYLVNIELQSSHETSLARTLWYRQVALDYRHDLPVLTVLVLLRKEANSPSLTGTYERRMPDGRFTNRYDYHVVRLWTGGRRSIPERRSRLGSPCPLTDVPEAALPQVVRRMADRINASPAQGHQVLDRDVPADGLTLFGRVYRFSPRRSSEHARVNDLREDPEGWRNCRGAADAASTRP